MVLFYKAVCVYLLGGLVGTVWETVLNFVNGNGFVYCNGSLFTPFNFVYGFGALVIFLLMQNQTSLLKVYLLGFFGGGAVEYFLSFLEEKLLGTRSWNYDDYFLNINGRTTVPYMAVWGLLCVFVVFLIFKPLNLFLDKLPARPMFLFSLVAVGFIAFDLAATVAVILRYAERNVGKAGVLKAARLIDRVYNDAYMKKHFPNMKFE